MSKQTLFLATAALALASGVAHAAATNTVPHLESFESYAVGENILSVPGWTGASGGGRISNDAGDLARLAAYTNAGGGLPLADSHDQLLTVRRDVRNALAGPQGATVLTDVLVQPEFRQIPPPEPDPTQQLGVYVNSNGLLYVFHRNTSPATNEWRELSGGPVIPSNSWIRLRVIKDYANHAFQVRINEDAPVSDTAGWTLPSGGAQPGPWFRMVQTNGALHNVEIHTGGNTVIDDLVVTSGEPVIETLSPANIGIGQADLRGFLSHTGLSDTAVEVYYGTSNGGTNAAAWAATNSWAAPRPQGLHVFSATGLAEAPHVYRFAAVNGLGRTWADETQTVNPYAITISAPDNEAKEEGPETGTIRVSRPGTATAGAATVNLEIGGTADNGVDYSFVSNTIEIADGASNAVITITPVLDPPEGDEAVVISIAPGDYVVGSPATAQVSIVDRPVGDLTWNDGSGDGSWNRTSTNWIGGEVFLDWDAVNFLGIAPGQVYIGDGVSSNPVDVYTTRVVVNDNDYTFVGGEVLSGKVQVKAGGTLIHPEFGQDSFGSFIRLQGGELWRTPAPDANGSQSFVTPIVVESASVLNGRQGNNTWRGDVELRDRLNLARVDSLSVNHAYIFSGTITIDQDTNNVNDRVIYHRGQNGTATFSGPIVDDTNATHTGTFPLNIGTRSTAGNIFFTGAKTYSHGTVVMYESGEGNAGDGLVVNAGSSLGTGPVTVQGIAAQGGALMTLNAASAVQGPLTLEPEAKVVVNAAGAVSASAGTIAVHNGATLELNTGIGINDSVSLMLMAGGRVDVTSNIFNEIVGALIVDGVNQAPGVYTAADHPGYILGTGSIEVDFVATVLIVR